MLKYYFSLKKHRLYRIVKLIRAVEVFYTTLSNDIHWYWTKLLYRLGYGADESF